MSRPPRIRYDCEPAPSSAIVRKLTTPSEHQTTVLQNDFASVEREVLGCPYSWSVDDLLT